MSHDAFEQLDRRLLSSPNAEDLMLRIVSLLRATSREIENHPEYGIKMLNAPETEYTIQTKTLNESADEIAMTLSDFRDPSIVSSRLGAADYGRGAASDGESLTYRNRY